MIKNEADIIESFVRYNMNFLEKMIFIDNGCTDDTIKILDLLKEENYNIEIYNEAHLDYEQYMLENKYLYKIAREYECDFVIPLDADEFLCSDSDLVEEMNKLSPDSIHYIYWRTYIITNDDAINGDILSSMNYIRDQKYDSTYTKVIIPKQLLLKYPIMISMGHHTVEGFQEIKININKNIKLAHYPVRSKAQLIRKIYLGTLSQVMRSKRTEGQGGHWFHLYRKLMSNQDIDLVYESYSYSMSQDEISAFNLDTDIHYKPIDISQCKNTKCKYTDYSQLTLEKYLLLSMEIICLKNVINNHSDTWMTGTTDIRPRCFIYGTGGKAKGLFSSIDKNRFNILAYIDSDKNKEFMIFEDKLVISPDKIKFFDYDIIIIASTYYNEIRDTLIKYHIDDNKIEDYTYFVRYCMQNT